MCINTSRGRLRCNVLDNNFIVNLLDIRYVYEQSVVNAFYVLFRAHPKPALKNQYVRNGLLGPARAIMLSNFLSGTETLCNDSGKARQK